MIKETKHGIYLEKKYEHATTRKLDDFMRQEIESFREYYRAKLLEPVENVLADANSTDTRIQVFACLAMNEILGDRVTDELISKLQGKDPLVMSAALYSACDRQGEQITELSIKLAESESVPARQLGFVLLEGRPEVSVTQYLFDKVLNSTDQVTRNLALQALHERKGDDVTEFLCGLTNCDNKIIRQQLPLAFMRRNYCKRIGEALIELFYDEEHDVRWNAMTSAGFIAKTDERTFDREVFEALEDAAYDEPNEETRKSILEFNNFILSDLHSNDEDD